VLNVNGGVKQTMKSKTGKELVQIGSIEASPNEKQAIKLKNDLIQLGYFIIGTIIIKEKKEVKKQ